MLKSTTASLKPAEVEKKWIVVDAENAVVGRLASFIAMRLRGKHRADYTPHVDCGDFVVVVNCSSVRLTGRKSSTQQYASFSGYPGGLRVRSWDEVMAKDPGFVVRESVRRMLPKSRLGKAMLKKLRTFPGADHTHQAQRPSPLVLS